VKVTALSFAELPPLDAYAAWRLRQDVFVVEQDCAYADLDGRDTEPGTRHVLLHDPDRAAGGAVVGCARVLDDGHLDPPVWRIGRVVLDPAVRGRGLADVVMRRALEECAALDPSRDVVLSAQSPLAGWYATFGFEVDGEGYLEDGIPHTPMRLKRL